MILCRTSPLTITTLQSPTKGLVLSLEWGWQETLVTKESVTSHWPKLSMDPQSATGSTGLKSILVLTYLPSDGRQVLTCLVQVSVCPELVWGAPGQRSSGFTVAPRTRAMAIVLMCPIQPPKSAVRNRAGVGAVLNSESLRAASVHVPRPRPPHQVWRPLHITPTRRLPVEKPIRAPPAHKGHA